MENRIKLETASLVLEFGEESGSLLTVYSKVSDWYVLDRPQLALSWRLMLPLDGRRNNNAWGHLQPVKPICTYSPQRVEFHWPTVTSEFGGEHRISVTTVCEIVDEQAVFRMNIENNDSVFVENVYYPYLGDLHRPQGCEQFTFQHGNYMHMETHELFPTFPNPLGTHSVDYPTLALGSSNSNPPMYPYALASDENGNGLYLGVAERRLEAVTWHAEAHPGWRNSNDFRLFSEDRFGNKDVFVRFAVGHLPFVAPGTSFTLLPFAMEAYRGDWSVGAACYTKVSRTWNRLPVLPEWARNPHSWLQVHINSPEDELRMRFTELPKIGEECVKYGIDAIQLVGWNNGGQDRGNPTHTPDPRLGTFDELREAIQKIQAMGVKVILFAKFVWADESNDDFREVYEPLSVKDPYGNYYVYKGYQYMTLSQVTDVNTRRLIPMCFNSEKYLELCNKEFKKCVDLGADGILFDECLHHSPTLCCFDTSHGHRYGEMTYRGDEKLIDGFRKILAGKEFLIAGEAVYDFQHDYYDISYGRTWGRDHKPVSRLMRPHGEIMTAVIGFNDRSMINQCLLNRYIISYEPYNFKGMPSDFPDTIAYGKKMDALRTDLRAYFWDGEFCDKIGGTVLLENGERLDSYAVYQAADGRRGMIICNYDEEQAIRVVPTIEGGTLTQYRLVDDTECVPFTGVLELPALSAVAVI